MFLYNYADNVETLPLYSYSELLNSSMNLENYHVWYEPSHLEIFFSYEGQLMSYEERLTTKIVGKIEWELKKN